MSKHTKLVTIAATIRTFETTYSKKPGTFWDWEVTVGHHGLGDGEYYDTEQEALDAADKAITAYAARQIEKARLEYGDAEYEARIRAIAEDILAGDIVPKVG